MKKNGIVNSEITKALADLGHTDRIVIGDLGLPIPGSMKKIDLALKKGTPTFLEVLEEVRKDMFIEKIVLAEEIKTANPELHAYLAKEFDVIEYVSHEAFKELTHETKGMIRTGEITPYANVILQSGNIF